MNVKNGILNLEDVKYIDESDFSKLNRSKLYLNDILFTYVGTIGQVALIPENDKFYLAPNVARIRILNENIIPQFLIYYFQTREFINNQVNKFLGVSSMKNLTMNNIRKFKIPIISIEQQKKIIEILNKFEKLTTDISEGLPAEIESRQKQYEYYRNKLLTFKELEVA